MTIQRMYRGYRDRLFLKRIHLLKTLSTRVRELVDSFLVSGNFWGFVLEVDADYRRFEHEKRVEEDDALTFVSTLLKQRKREEDQMMQVLSTMCLLVGESARSCAHCSYAIMMKDWFTASAMQSPIVHGARQAHSTYTESPNLSSLSTPSASASPPSTDSSSWPQALLESPVAADLIALSPNKQKSDVFPTDLPPKVIRHAIAEGFSLEDIVAVLYVHVFIGCSSPACVCISFHST